MVTLQDYLVKFSLADFQKIPSRGRGQVASAGGRGQVLLTAPYLMHGLEPAGDHVRIGAEARAFASQLDPHLTVADAINENG